MARRTVDQPTTPSETPALHGHYDGARGHQDEHRHLGGGKGHGHPDRQALGRVVAREEYVHPGHLDGERRAFKAHQRVTALQGKSATGSATSDDTPTVEVPAVGAFEPTTPTTDLALTTTGNGHRPQKYADLVRIAEKVDALRADIQRTIDLETELDATADLLAAARAQEANGEVVDPSILHQLEELHDRFAIRLQDWMGQRGLTGDSNCRICGDDL